MVHILTCSTRARLCLNVLPLLSWYSSWYKCLSILPAALYLTRRRRRTRSRLIHRTWLYRTSVLCCAKPRLFQPYLGILASAVPFLLPKPLCLPILRASFRRLARDRECIATGFRMIRPSLTNFRTVCLEFAF